MTMYCPECGHNNRPGMLFCEDCASALFDNDALATRKLARSRHDVEDIDLSAEITMLVRERTDPIRLPVTGKLVLGRADSDSTENRPDLDLTPYGAPEKGVSRLHAMLNSRQNPLVLVDMGSSNGTFVNGNKLIPNRPYMVEDGDEIRLGGLVTHIYVNRQP